MSDFRDLLVLKSKSDHSFGLEPTRLFCQVNIGDYQASIQASAFHYCQPRNTLEDIYGYESMEMALFKDNSWINPIEDERFMDFKRLNELEDFWENGDVSVGSFIPIDLIQDLCNYIEKIKGGDE